MKEKLLTVVWSASLFLLGASSMVTSVAALFGFSLPELAVQIFSTVQLLSLPILVYSTVKQFLRKRGEQNET